MVFLPRLYYWTGGGLQTRLDLAVKLAGVTNPPGLREGLGLGGL